MPAGPALSREQFDVRTRDELLNSLVNFVRLPTVFAAWTDYQLSHVSRDSLRVAFCEEQTLLWIRARPIASAHRIIVGLASCRGLAARLDPVESDCFVREAPALANSNGVRNHRIDRPQKQKGVFCC